MVKLRELEQKAAALTTLYQTFLARYEEASQQRSFPIAKARVISEAGDPTSASSPRKAMVLGLSLVLGLFGGAGAGAFQEFRERFFRTGDDVRALDLNFLGYLPIVGTPSVSREAKPSARSGLKRRARHSAHIAGRDQRPVVVLRRDLAQRQDRERCRASGLGCARSSASSRCFRTRARRRSPRTSLGCLLPMEQGRC